jgi:hypothetical protein
MRAENGPSVTENEGVPKLWDYRDGDELGAGVSPALDLTGFRVTARDGNVGKVDEATHDAGDSYVVVDTGMLSLKRVVLPAGLVERVDVDERTIYVDCTKEQIKNAPEIPYGNWSSEVFHRDLDEYFGEYLARSKEDDARRPRKRART